MRIHPVFPVAHQAPIGSRFFHKCTNRKELEHDPNFNQNELNPTNIG
jgi:hypothetical protein